jgi:hypothetical protein
MASATGKVNHTVTTYKIRDVNGTLHAVHERLDKPDGSKTFMWRNPDRTMSNGSIRTRELPLYNSENAWGQKLLFVTEGEKACDALTSIGIPAVATVCGASSVPDIDPELARGRRFIVWPDNDDAGRLHADRVAGALLRAGAAGVLVIRYTPSVKDAMFPKGADAHDFVYGMEPEFRATMVDALVEFWAEPFVPPAEPVFTASRSHAGARMDESVSAALHKVYGIDAAANRNVRCPKHDDKTASLHILPDDRRAYCHAATCEWSGRGVIAFDIEQEQK